LTHIVKLCDRHLARMVNPHFNNGLPANLSDRSSTTRCAFKGVQIQAGMFDVYSQVLSFPISTLFGVHEEGNQDITSHALTSGILALENLRLARYAVAQNLLATAQAVDLHGGPSKLAPRTRPIYEFVRSKAEYTAKEKPLHLEIERLYQAQVTDELGALLRQQTFCQVA
jgi:histidine ammonia-lyase